MATKAEWDELGDRTLEQIARPGRVLEGFGDQLSFYFRALAWAPRTLRRYGKETLRILTEVCFGAGALAIIGGTLGVMIGMTLFTGMVVGMQGYSSLDQLGTAALTGFISAYFNTREVAPLSAGLALSATVGCGFTAQLGAMRISEEIDALEVMAVPSMVYTVATRIWAAIITIIPLYLAALFASFIATEAIVTKFFSLSPGTYTHYFHLFLPPIDVFYSLIKAIVFAIIVTMIHCYYGYTASGGPAGVGTASGRAIRSSIVAVVVVNLVLSLIMWGGQETVFIAG
jgi:phospholipid/cholesterol/gamma-HCH transport system permease protein